MESQTLCLYQKKLLFFATVSSGMDMIGKTESNDFKKNQDFWIPKIERNIQRDCEVNEHLQADGWLVLRFWGKDIKKNLTACADEVERAWKNR